MNNNLNQEENVFINDNLNQNLETNNYQDDELIKSFIGPNYEKITHNVFNFSGFLFTFLYMFYRKMFLYGILFFLLNTLITILFKNFPIIIINTIIGLFFNKIYLYYVKNKITKIKNKNPNLDFNELKNLCAYKGGSSIGYLLLGFITEILLAIIILIISIILGLTNTFGGILKDLFNTFENTKNGIYDGAILFSTDEDIAKDFSIEIPNIFENQSNSYMYKYEYDNTSGVLTSCNLMFGKIDEFSDSQNMIEQMANYYQVSPMPDKKINNIVWHNFYYTNELGTFYYYATTKNNKTYLFDYSSYKDADSDCEFYKDIILDTVQSLK